MCAATAKCAVVGRTLYINTPYIDVPVTRLVICVDVPSQIPARLTSGQLISARGATYSGGSLPLVLLLAACGGGGGGGGPPVVSASAQNTSTQNTPATDSAASPSPPPATPATDSAASPSPSPATPATDSAVSPSPPPDTPAQRGTAVSGSLYDGPIQGAAIYVDVNGNRIVDNEDHLIDDETDSEGNFEGEIPERYSDHPLIADNRGAIHRDSHVDLPAYFLAPRGCIGRRL